MIIVQAIAQRNLFNNHIYVYWQGNILNRIFETHRRDFMQKPDILIQFVTLVEDSAFVRATPFDRSFHETLCNDPDVAIEYLRRLPSTYIERVCSYSYIIPVLLDKAANIIRDEDLVCFALDFVSTLAARASDGQVSDIILRAFHLLLIGYSKSKFPKFDIKTTSTIAIKVDKAPEESGIQHTHGDVQN